MEITEIKRPFQKQTQRRYNPDPYYRTEHWQTLRETHRGGSTEMPNGYMLKNIYCVDCYKETGKEVEGKNTDHIVPRKSGGQDRPPNLQTQCDTHHAKKSANEGKTK